MATANRTILALGVFVALSVLGTQLNGAPITWYIEDAALVNGGVLTGSFTFDASTGTLSNTVYLISTMDGSVLAPQTWNSSTIIPGAGYALPSGLQLVNSGSYVLQIDFSTPLSDGGGTINLVTTGDASLIFGTTPPVSLDFFQTGEVTSQVATLVNFQGGPSSAPILLPSGEPVSGVAGAIDGLSPQDFYTFAWNGGAFSATASITGMPNPAASYLFSEGSLGGCSSGSTATLNAGDSFTSTIAIGDLAPGRYCIGLDANSPNDPTFALTFNTPVEGATPEPATLVLLSAGLALLGLRALQGKRRPLHTRKPLVSKPIGERDCV